MLSFASDICNCLVTQGPTPSNRAEDGNPDLDARERLIHRRRAIERLGRRCSDITMASLSSQKALNNDSSSMRGRRNSQGFVLTIASPISRASISFPILSPPGWNGCASICLCELTIMCMLHSWSLMIVLFEHCMQCEREAS